MTPATRNALAVALLAVASHATGIANGWVQDDHLIVESNPVVARGSPMEIATSSWWKDAKPDDDGSLWRPVTIASFAVERKLASAPSAALSHATNVLLHAAVAVAIAALGAALGLSPAGAFAAGALHAVHPAASEAVFNVVGRAELLAALFSLGAILSFVRGRPWLAAACAGAAIGSKESALALPFALAAIEALRGPARRPWLEWSPLAAAILLAVGLRTFALEAFFPSPALPPIDNPLAALDATSRIAAALGVAWRYARLVVVPWRLTIDYSGGSVDAASGFGAPAPWLGLAVLAGAAVLAARRRPQAGAAGAALFLLSFLVVGNLVRPIGVAMGERLLYLPLAGVALAAGAAFDALPRKTAAVSLAALLALYGARTLVRGLDWKDDRAVFEAATEANPAAPRAWFALGQLEASAIKSPAAEPERTARALARFDRSLLLWPGQPNVAAAKGQLLARAGDLARAEIALREAIRLNPRHPAAWSDLGLVLQKAGRTEEARRAFRRAVLHDPGQARAWASLGHLAFEAGRWSEAAEAYGRAVALGRNDLGPRRAEAQARAAGRL